EESPLFKEVLTKLATQFDLWLEREKRDAKYPGVAGFDLDARTVRETEGAAADWAGQIADEREVGEASAAKAGVTPSPADEAVGGDNVGLDVELQNMAIVD